MEPLVVEVTRGDVVEARHVVHAVAIHDGRVELALGDPGFVTFLRSSAKPLQALPIVRARTDLDDEQVALLCASHGASPEQIAVVRRLLAAAPATEDDLACGPTGIAHVCSGKHAGLLALCRANGWPLAGYRAADHPCQTAMLREVAAAAEVAPSEVPVGVDGCGVPTFALGLERAAHAYSRLASLDGGERVVEAVRAHPELLRGPVDADSAIPLLLDGWIAKGGNEGLFCAVSSDGLAVALKVADGAFRALLPAFVHTLELLGIDASALDVTGVRNSHGEVVGAVRIAPTGSRRGTGK